MVERKKSFHSVVVGFGIVMTLLFAVVFWKGLSLQSSKHLSPLIGTPAKEFRLRLLQGSEILLGRKAETVELADLKGSPLIINFWASWCGSCAEEARTFENFWKEHKTDGVKVIGIAVHDKAEEVLSFVNSFGKTYPIGLDEDGKVSLNYGVTGVPETIFINAQGLVVHKETGPVDRPLLEKFLAKILESST